MVDEFTEICQLLHPLPKDPPQDKHLFPQDPHSKLHPEPDSDQDPLVFFNSL